LGCSVRSFSISGMLYLNWLYLNNPDFSNHSRSPLV
jgi:hypothetical protein